MLNFINKKKNYALIMYFVFRVPEAENIRTSSESGFLSLAKVESKIDFLKYIVPLSVLRIVTIFEEYSLSPQNRD